jgi:hypothetical protein
MPGASLMSDLTEIYKRHWDPYLSDYDELMPPLKQAVGIDITRLVLLNLNPVVCSESLFNKFTYLLPCLDHALERYAALELSAPSFHGMSVGVMHLVPWRFLDHIGLRHYLSSDSSMASWMSDSLSEPSDVPARRLYD